MGKSREENSQLKKSAAYARKWREIERDRRWHNTIITEYVKTKFWNIYHEANCFCNAINALHPRKHDLRKTPEFKKWKSSIMNTENSESSIIVQTLDRTVQYDDIDNQQNEQSDGQESEQSDDQESEQSDEQESEQSEQESEQESAEQENNDGSYADNMLLEIPLQNYIFPQQSDNSEVVSNDAARQRVQIPTEMPVESEIEILSDERIQEIIAELRQDPDLQRIFDDDIFNQDDEDEGIEMRTMAEEVEQDIEPFDYRLEVELENWENQ